ncbi:DUF1320 domain-containing protein [Chryseobacterium herbae]|uniref:DUF1320 domain-containing protein n=1 Tax=Chryseobacterium herbae TaxID=2976476 RepID=A0ABT2IYP4_9FLAO|nr:DUF1320 domain-containing protein [Chryseobacterium sp. pc1-10]MCT2563961.1 DUF1320 domain-containing protein [Chryseobacterium sp. pc1-10]
MAFLTKEELKTITTIEIIDLITNKDDDIVGEIIKEDISLMETYLGSYYDMNEVFSKTGDDRNRTVVKYLKAIISHDLPKRRKKPVPADADADYQEAMNWLEKIASGEWKANLPRKKEDLDGDGIPDEIPFLKLGSKKSYKNHW